MGSDWPVTSADPLQQMEVAVRRVGHETRDAEPFLPHEAIPLAAALAGFTSGSAYVNHDDDAGTIEVGKRADLVTPTFDAASTIVYAAGRGDVVDVWADGRQVVDNRTLTTIDLPHTLSTLRTLTSAF